MLSQGSVHVTINELKYAGKTGVIKELTKNQSVSQDSLEKNILPNCKIKEFLPAMYSVMDWYPRGLFKHKGVKSSP